MEEEPERFYYLAQDYSQLKEMKEFYSEENQEFLSEESKEFFSEEDYETKLISLIDGMEESFPKNPDPMDSYWMFQVYRDMPSDKITDEDRKNWLKHTKRYMNATKKEKINVENTDLDKIFESLPHMGGTAREVFQYSLDAFTRMSRNYQGRPRLRPQLEERAYACFKDLLEEIKITDDKEKKLSIYQRAVGVTRHVKPSIRIGLSVRCFDEMQELTRGTEGPAREIQHKRGIHFRRIYSGIPTEQKNRFAERRYWLR